jgi:hypothetical protein
MMFAIDEGVVVDTITVVFGAEITFHNETKKARIR